MNVIMEPFIEPEVRVREFSLKATVLGLVLGLVFAVGNAYLGLRVGMTISASIPAAVFSMAILRTLFKRVSILENNIVQTMAAVGEGLAAGVIFTIPALFLLGAAPSIPEIFSISLLGGILGILFMIPMRRYIIVKEHATLPFPEGTACAEILKAGETKQPHALLALWGLLIGVVEKIACNMFFLWNEVVTYTAKFYEGAVFSIDCTPSLLGVGFIIGPRIAAVTLAGGALGWWVIIPLIREFGQGLVTIYPSTIVINQMSPDAIWSDYVRYIGAGAIAIGGLMSLFQLLPMLRHTIIDSFKEIFFAKTSKLRTEKDISLTYLIVGSLAVIVALWAYPGHPFNTFTILLLVILAFFFTAVTSITVGLVGSSSNPVSGMTLTTLLITSLIFVGLGWTERFYLISAIMMGSVASIAICLAATTSQDLKTGYLLGATPWKQQLAEMVGLILPCAAIGSTLYLLNKAYGFGTTQLPAPQATLLTIIATGVIKGQLPVILVSIGVALGLCMKLMKIPVLPFAMGLYLPLSLSTAMAVGGFINYLMKGKIPWINRGVLAASGLVAGDACTGVVIALLTVMNIIPVSAPPIFNNLVSLIVYLGIGAILFYFCRSSVHKSKQTP